VTHQAAVSARLRAGSSAGRALWPEAILVPLLAITWMIVNSHRYTTASYLGASTIMADFGITAAAAGLMAAAYFPAYGVLQVPAGVMADRIRPALILRWSVGFLAASSLLFAVAPNVEWATVARVCVGLSSAPVWLASLKILADLSMARYPRRVGIQVTTGAVGTMFSLFVLPILLSHWEWRGTGLALTVPLVVLLAVLCMARLPEPSAQGKQTIGSLVGGLGPLMRHGAFWWLALPAIVWNGAYFGVVTWLPRFSRDVLQMPPELVGLLPACSPIGLLLGGILAGSIQARWPGTGRWLYYGGGALTVLVIALLPAIQAFGAIWALYLLILLMGILFGSFFCWMSLVYDLVPKGRFGAVTGYINFLSFIPAFLDPLAVGLIFDLLDRPTTANPTYSAAAYAAGFYFLAASVLLGLVVGVASGRGVGVRSRGSGVG
jgi:MFS family permease